MIRRPASVLLSLAALLLVAALGHAEETTADWLKRILDPSTIGVTHFPGSSLSKKITVDTIRYDRGAPPGKRTAVYMIPVAELDAAATYFEETLDLTPLSDTDAHGLKRYLFAVTEEPARAKGLRISILRSPWVDGMAQIQMEYLSPAAPAP